jgi:capsular exopolysaccharide family
MNKDYLYLTPPAADSFQYVEAIKTLRTNIQFSGSDIKNVLITSVHPNEGKSTVSFSLALAFAESGKKTLYIDADIRKSVFLQRQGIAIETVGLSQVLSGQVKIEDAIYVTNIDSLDVVLPGPVSPLPTELFEDAMCEKFFKYINEQNYDFVIIDSPPLGSVIDAAILSKYADGIALLVESEVTTNKVFKRVKSQIDKTEKRFLGVIINKVRMNKGSYYGKYYGHYGHYGESG